jgi:A/G-specific adenine glycosylase
MLSARELATFRKQLLAWFHQFQRDLPWRRTQDPYRIWLSEIMLQQTRVAAVIPYYKKFLERFPDVQTLAAAPQEDVLRLWSGLGYYSRARNLHLAAKEIVARNRGKFPRELEAALRLPGIGLYTAAAVLSIAYNVPLAVLDGNVARVLARLNAMRGDLRAPRRWNSLAGTAQQLLALEAPGDWNQALMELGETICTPQTPRCQACPASRSCRAYAQGIVHQIPAPRRKRAAVQQKIAAAILLDSRGRTLLVQDPGAHDEVLFSRLWQFPAVEVKRTARAELEKHLRATLQIKPSSLEPLAHARHGVTFRNIALLPFLASVKHLPWRPRTRIVPLSSFTRLPVSSATRKLAQSALRPRLPRIAEMDGGQSSNLAGVQRMHLR